MAVEHYTDILEETTIVDADIHVSITAEEVATHLDEPFKTRTLNNFCYPKTVGSTRDNTVYGKIEDRSLSSPEEIQRVLREEFKIDYPIVNNLKNISRIEDTPLAMELMTAFNNVLIEKYLDDTDYYGLATIAPQNPSRAAEEIDRVANESQIVGLFIFNSVPYAPLGDPQYDPIYEAAEDNGLNVAYHAGAAGGFPTQFPLQNTFMETFFEIHALTHLWAHTLTVVSLIANGVPEKFPDLNFILLESGISWAPYMMWRLNKEYSIRRSEAPLLEKSPEEYLREQFFWGSQPLGEPNDPAMMDTMFDLVGTDSMMFATDYPHWDFDHPEALATYLQNTLTESQREDILWRTPAKAFDLDI